MANFLQNVSAAANFFDLVPPGVVAATGNGTGVSVATAGANWMSARLCVGVVTALTTLDVKLQASPTIGGTYIDIPGAVFTTVVAATQSQVIDFELPTVTVPTAAAYLFIRAVTTLVGTSVNMHVEAIGATDWSGINAFVNQPLPNN